MTVALLALIFWRVDRTALLANLRSTHWAWFTLAVVMFVPQVGVIAFRWRRLVMCFAPITWGECVRIVLASATMNLVLPSKLGDLSKGVFLKRTGTLDLKRAMNIVVFEKMLDVAALALMMLGGVALMLACDGATPLQRHAAIVAGAAGAAAVAAVAAVYFIPMTAFPGFRRALEWLGGKPRLKKLHDLVLAGHEVITMLQSRGARRGRIVAYSLLIWVLHLAQIYFFFLCLGVRPDPGQYMSLVPLAIFIGLVPVTIAGFGTRDAAIISLFAQYPPSLMFGIALYINLRYIVPAIAGIPFLNRYISYARELKQ